MQSITLINAIWWFDCTLNTTLKEIYCIFFLISVTIRKWNFFKDNFSNMVKIMINCLTRWIWIWKCHYRSNLKSDSNHWKIDIHKILRPVLKRWTHPEQQFNSIKVFVLSFFLYWLWENDPKKPLNIEPLVWLSSPFHRRYLNSMDQMHAIVEVGWSLFSNLTCIANIAISA